jgi:hypothetical protein
MQTRRLRANPNLPRQLGGLFLVLVENREERRRIGAGQKALSDGMAVSD